MEQEKEEMTFTAQTWKGRKIAIPRTVTKGLGIFEGDWVEVRVKKVKSGGYLRR